MTLYSCGVDYDAETRLVSETRLIDKFGNPIVGKPVEIWVSDESGSDMIANTVTDANGKSLLIFPAPNDMENGRIDIRFPQGGSFQEKNFREIKRTDFTDYKYTLNDIVLYASGDIVGLYIDFFNSSGDTLTALYLEDDNASENIYVNSPEDYFQPQQYYNVLKNTTADLAYTVKNAAGVESTHTVAIPIGTDNVEYTLNY